MSYDVKLENKGNNCFNESQIVTPYMYVLGNRISTKESLLILLALPTLAQAVQDYITARALIYGALKRADIALIDVHVMQKRTVTSALFGKL